MQEEKSKTVGYTSRDARDSESKKPLRNKMDNWMRQERSRRYEEKEQWPPDYIKDRRQPRPVETWRCRIWCEECLVTEEIAEHQPHWD
jgi:hypothetical protein